MLKEFGKMNKRGKLFLIPTTLGAVDPFLVLPKTVKDCLDQLQYFFVENSKTARRFIKNISPEKVQGDLVLQVLNKYTTAEETRAFLDFCDQGISIGLISEAGVPAVADPGSNVVLLAHQKGIEVVPLVGPSSITLAMMSSGLNGQNFAFNGYLPIDKGMRKSAIKDFEKHSRTKNQSQIFIETPYRNHSLLEDLKEVLSNGTLLSIATDITLPSQFIKTQSVQQWKKEKVDLHKRPTIFIFHSYN